MRIQAFIFTGWGEAWCGQPGQVVHGQSEAAAVSPVPAEWWAGYEHLMQYLNVDAEPWQDRELRRLVAEHGREKFADLELVKEFLNA